jgi:hypothetical protein
VRDSAISGAMAGAVGGVLLSALDQLHDDEDNNQVTLSLKIHWFILLALYTHTLFSNITSVYIYLLSDIS